MIQNKTVLKALPKVLRGIEVPGWEGKIKGKVREMYIKGDKRVVITTDRLSAFDVNLVEVPYKGAVLNQLAGWWFEKTRDIVDNHMVEIVDPNVMVVRNCKPIPVEMVVRGYISGVTTTSIWYSYQRGERVIYGIKFPDGLVKNQKLPEAVITPTTHGGGKSGHDERLTRDEIIERGIVEEKLYKKMERTAVELFRYGSEWCRKRGLILVDTKYEFGLVNGKLTLMDEIHTPDSSRFWLADSYEARLKKGLEPENYDKEFLRLWYAKKGYQGDGKPPKMPKDLVVAVAKRYVSVYEKITGKKFEVFSYPIEEKIVTKLKKWEQKGRMTYKKAGVDRKSGDEASFRAYKLARKTYRNEVIELGGISAFGAGFDGYENPYLLAGADGVGTKLKIAFKMGVHDTVGIDLVAMSVNDLIRRGAEPIIFLPYLATSKIVPKKAEEIARGIAKGCRIAGCSILGGETAELPDFYKKGEYDLAGSAIGVVEKDKVITGEEIREGDILVGLASSGLHSNGFSLARKVLLDEFDLDEKIDKLGGKSLGEELLIPTKIYVKPILALLRSGVKIHGMAHITGGGIMEKLGKIVPKGMVAKIKAESWKTQAIFKLIEKKGGIEKEEMFRTFNMGLGMILVVPKSEVEMIKERIKKAKVVGKVEANSGPVVVL